MERKEIYKRIDGERDYQDVMWTPRRALNGVKDEEKPPAEWITYIEHHLQQAKKNVYYLNDNLVMDELRKVAALAVRCMELHGCPEREVPVKIDDSNR